MRILLILAAAWSVPLMAGGDAQSGLSLYKQHCALCHGAKGQGVPPMFPNLTSKPIEAYAAMMDNYRAGHGHKMMVDMAQSLNEQQTADLLAWIATLATTQ